MRYRDTQEDVMTYADQMRTEGRLRDKQEVLKRLVSRRFALTAEDRERIERTEDPDRLDAALDAVVVAQSKEAVLAELGE